jgi:hypothetical protein
MRRTLTLLFVLSPLLGLVSQQTPDAKPISLALTHVTVIDTAGGPNQPDMTVVIQGSRIVQVAKSNEIRVPKNAKTVNATGKFLIPGLWDMHVHWYEKNYLPLFIANGVTGTRQMYGVPTFQQWRKQIEAGELLGPHILIPSPIVDGPKPVWPGSIAVANESEGRQAVIQVKQAGADFVKVYSRLPRDAYFAIADESKKQGIPFEGHVPCNRSAAGRTSATAAASNGSTSARRTTTRAPSCSRSARRGCAASQPSCRLTPRPCMM